MGLPATLFRRVSFYYVLIDAFKDTSCFVYSISIVSERSATVARDWVATGLRLGLIALQYNTVPIPRDGG
jgi:hypothetical protein